MLSGLMLTAFLMGVGGIPHCTAMCGAACSAILRGQTMPLSALIGRWLGYALLGAVAAGSASIAARWATQSAVLQPLWILAQLGALMLGLILAWTGRMPEWLDQRGRDLHRVIQSRMAASPWANKTPALRMLAPLVAGMAWAALPCGLLYGAVTVAALGNGPLDGALVMSAFALPSALGVWAAPWWLARIGRAPLVSSAAPFTGVAVPMVWLKSAPIGDSALSAAPVCGAPSSSPGLPWARRLTDPRWAVRLSGGMLAAMSAWAVYHRVLDQWQAWCA